MLATALVIAVPASISSAIAADPTQAPDSAPNVAAAQDADPVEALIQGALAAYRDGRSQEAIRLLHTAISAMQHEEDAGTLKACLPAAPEGWTVEVPRMVVGSYGGPDGESFQMTQISRTYKHENGARVDVQITNSPQLVLPQRQLAETFANEQNVKMMNQDPNKTVKTYRKDGWTGWTQIDKTGDTAEAIALGDKLMVTLRVNRADTRIFEQFWERVNLDKLKKFDK